ncbi:MAG: pyrimidine 5-nucleotidase [Hyphomicrobiales bacterium]|nr:pyrimidine 5-nucleotidase [Hyphomicrobiales bacterium]
MSRPPETAAVPHAAVADPAALEGVRSVAERFAHVDTWVFDLDNTLYRPDSDLWPLIDDRMTVFMCHMFGLDGLSTRALQKYYYLKHGTTLKGLVDETGMDPGPFLDFVHDIDRSSIVADAALASAIAALPGRRLILTNGSRDHALRTCEALGIDALFEDVFDIVAANLLPKPHPDAYEMFFARHDVEPSRAAMFEDIARNLLAPHARGMVTTLVTPVQGSPDHRDPWETARTHPPHVDFVTDDLAAFLATVRPPAR